MLLPQRSVVPRGQNDYRPIVPMLLGLQTVVESQSLGGAVEHQLVSRGSHR